MLSIDDVDKKVNKISPQDAYEIYDLMGHSRSLSGLSVRTGIPVPTLKRWSSRHGWSERLERREQKVSKKVEQKIIETRAQERFDTYSCVESMVERILKVYQESIAKLEAVPEDVSNPAKLKNLLENIEKALKIKAMNAEIIKEKKEQDRELIIRWISGG